MKHSTPVIFDIATANDVPSSAELAARAPRGTHVVLRFSPVLDAGTKATLIARLSNELPDHSVFDSGSSPTSTSVTVMPVVPRHDVLARRAEIDLAIEDYRQTCSALVSMYFQRSLPRDWMADEHGEHCGFRNKKTGQIVEAPLADDANAGHIDPYFFALFVQSTAGHESVSSLILSPFHDAARMLDLVLRV